MEATAVTAAIAPRAWAERNDCNLSLRWRGPLVARAIVFGAFLPHPSRYGCNCLLFLLAYPFRLPIAGGGCVSRVDFDQYAGQYEATLSAQTNFFDGDSGYFARYKIELAQQLVGPVNSILDFGCGASTAACRTCARSSRKPRSSVAILQPKVSPSHAGRTRAAVLRQWMSSPGCEIRPGDRLLRLSPYPAAGSVHPLLLQPSEGRRTLHHLRAQSDQSGHASFGQACPFDADAVLLSMREMVERMRNAHLHY
jgi:hypothetical protein